MGIQEIHDQTVGIREIHDQTVGIQEIHDQTVGIQEIRDQTVGIREIHDQTVGIQEIHDQTVGIGGGREDDPDHDDLLQALLVDEGPHAGAAERDEGDLFEEEPEDEFPDFEESDLRGLSQEEFEKIFREVGDGLEFDTFYVSRPLRSRTSSEVYSAVQELFLTLKAEGLPIARVHADRARELRTVPLRRWLLERGALCTYTEGQAPQANGRAESAVKWVKAQARKLLTASALPRSCWAMAAVYATWARRETQLGRGQEVLPFGTPVHVRSKVYGAGGRYDLNLRWRYGRYVGPSLDVRGGHVVLFEDGSFLTSAHLRPHLVDSDKIVDLGKYEALVMTPARRLRSKMSLEERVEFDPLDADVGDHDPERLLVTVPSGVSTSKPPSLKAESGAIILFPTL